MVLSIRINVNGGAFPIVHRLIARPSKIHNICSDCVTGLGDGSIDAVLLHDVFHGLSDPN
jgi:hypothetical protein